MPAFEYQTVGSSAGHSRPENQLPLSEGAGQLSKSKKESFAFFSLPLYHLVSKKQLTSRKGEKEAYTDFQPRFGSTPPTSLPHGYNQEPNLCWVSD